MDREQFHVSRRLPDATAGVAILLLDAHVLGRRRGLADVRIVDAAGRQIPYIVEQRAEPIVLSLRVPARETRGSLSLYRLELPQANWPNGTRLVVETSGRVFDRTVFLRRIADSHRNRRGGSSTRTSWRSADPDRVPAPLTLDVPLRDARMIELAIDEGDNAPLPITSARLLVPRRALRFHHPGTALYLLYDNPRIAAPRYDLELLAQRLASQPSRVLTLPPAPLIDTDDSHRGERRLFWAALVVAGAVLIVILLRLLLKPETSRAPNDTT